MNKPVISMIAAIGKNRELGKDNKLLWHIPEDMKRFKQLTRGHAVIMGRNTFESIGRPLPDRINIVITHDLSYNPPGCIIVHSLGEALGIAKEKERDEIFIIGGGQVYVQALPYTDKIYLTVVDSTFDADTFFPEYTGFKKIVAKRQSKDDNYTYAFLDLEK